jgi:hypothetical protein
MLWACTSAPLPSAVPVLKKPAAVAAKIPYTTALQHIQLARQRLADSLNYAEIERVFVSCITDTIIPYWYGTAWNFNGTTVRPGQGSIACGYFVATVLQHAGLRVNRVATGQMPAQKIIQQFAPTNAITSFSHQSLTAIGAAIKLYGPGLYIIGLDFHVGFLHCTASGIWFIHARYNGPRMVVKENFYTSFVISQSARVVVGKISHHRPLLERWVKAAKS